MMLINVKGGDAGLNAANGDWILFLDADDYWCRRDVLRTFENLIYSADVDIIEANKYIDSHEWMYKMCEFTKPTKIQTYTPSEYYTTQHHPCIWNSVYKKQLIQSYLFREDVYYEDTDWKIKVYCAAKSIRRVDFEFYVYYNNSLSTTHYYNKKLYFDALKANARCF